MAAIVRPARLAEAKQLGRSMVAALDSRLKDLGPWFVTYLHRHMVSSPYCVCLVAEKEGDVIGYGAAFTSTARFYREFLVKKGLLASLMVLPWLLRPRNLRTAFSALTYSKKSPHDDPEAELVSLVVFPSARGEGAGHLLFQSIQQELRKQGIEQLKITTSSTNEGANAFYARQGSTFIRTEPLYRDSELNVYVHQIV